MGDDMKYMRIEWTYDDQVEVTIRDDEGTHPTQVCVSSTNLHHLFEELVPKSMHTLMDTRLRYIRGAIRDATGAAVKPSAVSSQPTEE